MDKDTFRAQIEEAMSHIRDIVRLRVLPVARVLVPDAARSRAGWELSEFLLQAVDDLRPGPVASTDWVQRRWDILNLRYVNGLHPEETASRLAISRRHFYRQLQRALDEFSDYLWAKLDLPASADELPSASSDPQQSAGSVDVLQREFNSLGGPQRGCSLGQTLESALQLLQPILTDRAIQSTLDLMQAAPKVPLTPEVLKQFLVGLLSDLLTIPQVGTLALGVRMTGNELVLETRATRLPARRVDSKAIDLETIAARFLQRPSTRLARQEGVRIQWKALGEEQALCQVSFPMSGPATVLVVDDNEDVRALFRRYLLSGGYSPLLAASGAEAIRLAHGHALHAITLDLMMSEQDGWDVLQALRSDTATCNVPIIVCSVLDHEDISLMLGAKAFLKKPVMRESLLRVLA